MEDRVEMNSRSPEPGLATDPFKAEAAVQGPLTTSKPQSRLRMLRAWARARSRKEVLLSLLFLTLPHRANHRVSCHFSSRIFVFIKLQSFRVANLLLATEEAGWNRRQ